MKNKTLCARKIIWASLASLLAISPLYATAATYPRAAIQPPAVTCVKGSPHITIDWASVRGATSYSVFRMNKALNVWTNLSSKKSASIFKDRKAARGGTYQYQVKTYFGSSVSYSNVVSVQAPTCASTIPESTGVASPPPPAPQTATNPAPTPQPSPGEIKFDAYLTGYGWPDNTPAGANISHGVIRTKAGGVGTFSDPITIAVGHSIINGKDILDFPKGTKFYIPTLRKYFIVEDTCGDGNTPQNGPCHTGYNGLPWLDAWVGGENAPASSVYACEEKITGVHAVIQNPSATYLVVPGPVFNVTCATLFGNTPVIN